MEKPAENIKYFITAIMVATSNCSLYTKEHAAFDELAKKAFAILSGMLRNRLDIMVIENDLIVDNTPVKDAGIQGMNLVKRLKRKRIARIEITEGVTVQEIRQLIIGLAESGTGLMKYPHIKSGAVDVAMTASSDHSDPHLYSATDEIEKVKDIFHSASPFKKLNVAGLEEVVVHFISTFKREASILKFLSPVKSFDEYTYTHATNVAVLSVLQSQSLGIDSGMLHDIGISALLHDAGKMFVSKEILEKKGKLDNDEFAEVQKHTLHGARYLAQISDLPRLASIIAFEHHVKFDGSGYPRITTNGKHQKQHIYSQIVAISDFYDALRSNRPYREGMEIQEIFVLMKKTEARDFNPFLLNNFIHLMQNALSD
jgi:HD-GYP domain-containing protein (c-di-GMP phosphodiesterase class II)